MIDFHIKKPPVTYDVVIVGSGAGGGMAGYVLANAGLKVLMLEGGPFFDPAKDSQQLKFPWNVQEEGSELQGPLATLTVPLAAGNWKENLILPKIKPSLTGSVHARSVAVPII